MIAFVKPQLCKTMTKKKDWRADAALIPWAREVWVAEFKLDGHRRLLGREVAWSRIGTVRPSPELQACLPPGVLLDGELVLPEGSASHLVAHGIAEAVDDLRFVAFDLLYLDGVAILDRPWEHRRRALVELVERVHAQHPAIADRLLLSEAHAVTCERDVERLMHVAEQRQLEGLVLKKAWAPYKPKSRSAWIKLKFTDTVDVIITDCDSTPTEWRVRPGEVGKDGILYPDGRHSDPWLAGHVGLSYGFVIDGKVQHVGSLGVTGPRAEMEQHVGKVAEVKVYGQFEDTGALRHPIFLRFRDDKGPDECVLERRSA